MNVLHTRSRHVTRNHVAADDPFDPCYHQACDDFDNVSLVALDEMTDAMAHAILTFAMTTSAVQGTDKGSDKATYDPTFRGHRAIK
jgi:copper homeostasis protein CutC